MSIIFEIHKNDFQYIIIHAQIIKFNGNSPMRLFPEELFCNFAITRGIDI
jgi:hypothetical protein